jgi:hypothetical protein
MVKLVVNDDGRESLIDLLGDPGEHSPGEAVGAVADRLRSAIASRGSGVAAASAAVPSAEADAETIAQLEQQMKLLGYM